MQRPEAACEPAASGAGGADDATSRWPHVVALLCSLAGLAVAFYLSAVHLSSTVPLYCAENGVINCAQVTTSPSSIVLGVPVAYYGVIWFGVMTLLLVLRHRAVPLGRLVWVAGGVAGVLYLLYSELFVIGAICLWCSLVHLLILAIFALTVLFPGGTDAAGRGDR
ncbi:MAG TPA: vitamin K epoxide reductase family protein [Chloroflexota bacterium]